MRIAQSSGQNLRRAVLMMEACKVDTYPFTETQEIQLPDWERFISSMADVRRLVSSTDNFIKWNASR